MKATQIKVIQLISSLALGFFILFLASCSTTAKDSAQSNNTTIPPPSPNSAEVEPAASPVAIEPPTTPSKIAVVEPTQSIPVEPAVIEIESKPIYFSFDSSIIEDSTFVVVKEHVHKIQSESRSKVVLEGNTDERGSKEYNLALGERRTAAVKEALVGLGIKSDILSTMSYGEENPASVGHTEDSWKMNRRVDVVYQ